MEQQGKKQVNQGHPILKELKGLHTHATAHTTASASIMILGKFSVFVLANVPFPIN